MASGLRFVPGYVLPVTKILLSRDPNLCPLVGPRENSALVAKPVIGSFGRHKSTYDSDNNGGIKRPLPIANYHWGRFRAAEVSIYTRARCAKDPRAHGVQLSGVEVLVCALNSLPPFIIAPPVKLR